MESEEKFLNKIAKEIGLRGKPLQVFNVCFSAHNKDLDDADLARKIWAPGGITTPEDSMRPHLTKIYGLLEQKLGCPAKGTGKDRLEGSERKLTHYCEWLWDVQYPEYIAADESTITESPSSNPFSDRVRIEDPTRFFGRQEFLRRLVEDLQKGMSLALVGETQSGKSSVLQYLCRKRDTIWQGIPPQFIYMDMLLINDGQEFQSELCHSLGLDTCNNSELVRKLQHLQRKYILCLDEVGVLGDDTFSRTRLNLRGLVDGHSTPLTLITTSQLPLKSLFPDNSRISSSLAEFCQQRNVLPFDKQETIDFIHMRLEPTGVRFSDRDIAELYQQTNGHPGQLQQAAADLFVRIASALPNRSTNTQTT
jgi:hypothetical protein